MSYAPLNELRDGVIVGGGVASAATPGYAGLPVGSVVIGAVASSIGLRSTIVMLASVAPGGLVHGDPIASPAS